jgi:hypothetical protein
MPQRTSRSTCLIAVTAVAATAALLLMGGCVEQTMTITTDPPGALVSLNGQELGRTPLQQDFIWYGNYDVAVRKDGYQTLKTHKWVKAPWWNWPPFDLIADCLPWQIRDHEHLKFALAPVTSAATQPSVLMERAMEMQGQLQSSEHTRTPSTQPTSQPSRRGTTTKPAR